MIKDLNIIITKKETKWVEFIYELDTGWWDVMEYNQLNEQLYYTDSTGYVREAKYDKNGDMFTMDSLFNFNREIKS